MSRCIDCKNFVIGNKSCSSFEKGFLAHEHIYEGIWCTKYKEKLSIFIRNMIQNEVCSTKGSNCWLSRKYIIIEKLNKLNPDVPKDNSVGKIAFDVLGKARMKIRTQRFLTRKLNLNSGFLPDHTISIIADKINSELFPNIKTELIKGKDITEAYRKNVGNESCMSGSCANFTKLYEMNPDKIQMLTMYYMNDSARAILYKLDNDKGHYLDRVYTSCCLLENKMYDYADNNNWISYNNINVKTTEEKQCLIISDLTYEDGYVPYMDTFEGTISGHRLTLSRNGDFYMDSTSGYIDGGGYTCEWCDEHVHEDETVSIGDSIYCESCANEHFTFCERCNEYVRNDDAVLIKDKNIYVCDHCASNKYVQCEDCNEYNGDDWHRTNNDKVVCNDCAENNYTWCDDCGVLYDSGDVNEDGYCESCKPEPEDEEDHSTHVDDPRPYISCKVEDTKELPHKDEIESLNSKLKSLKEYFEKIGENE